MGTRLADKAIWSNPWFADLEDKHKLLWFYLLDNCDIAGVWKLSLKLIEFNIHEGIFMGQVPEPFEGHIVAFDEDSKWLVLDYIEYQQRCIIEELNPSNNCHKGILRLLVKYSKTEGFPESHHSNQLAPSEPLARGTGKSKSKSNSLDSSGRGGGSAEGGVPKWAHHVYASYPRKVGKKAALAAICRAGKTVDHQELLTATIDFAEATGRWPPERHQFIPHPATFFNQGRYEDDPKEWEVQGVNGDWQRPWEKE